MSLMNKQLNKQSLVDTQQTIKSTDSAGGKIITPETQYYS